MSETSFKDNAADTVNIYKCTEKSRQSIVLLTKQEKQSPEQLDNLMWD